MLKLTPYHGRGGSIFINPKLVTSIVARHVRDTDNDPPREAGKLWAAAYRVEGCSIEFGGPEDSACAVMESAEAVAECVAYFVDGLGYGMRDVAAWVEQERLFAEIEAKKREACGCTGEMDCECSICVEIPF